MTSEMKAMISNTSDDTRFARALTLWRERNHSADGLSFDKLPSWAQSEILRGAQILKTTGDERAVIDLYNSAVGFYNRSRL